MAISEKKIKGRSYFYEVKSYREGGKVKQKVLRYFGRVDPRKDAGAKPIIKNVINASYRFGDVALLYHCAQNINFFETIDKLLPKRQGLSFSIQFFLLIAHRITGNKPSMVNLPRWLESTFLPQILGISPKDVSKNTLSYCMDAIINEEKGIDHSIILENKLFINACSLFKGSDDVFFYDLTSTYFEGCCCPIARFGYSRDGLDDKLQINIGMIVDRMHGFPMISKVFDGNIHDSKTVYEMIYYCKFVLKLSKVMLIMDRGMDSEDNIRILDTAEYDYIVGLSSRNAVIKYLKQKTLIEDMVEINIDGKKVLVKKFIKNLFGKRRVILLYYNDDIALTQKDLREEKILSAEQKLRDAKNLTLSKVKEIVKGVSKFIKVETENKNIIWKRNQVEINKSERRDGKFCIMPNKDLLPKDIYTLYFSKDKVEKGFRYLKQDIDLHPTRKRLTDRVKADIVICHLALLLLRMAEKIIRDKKIDIFWDTISTETDEIRVLEHQNCAGKRFYNCITNNKIQKDIVDKLELTKYINVNTTNQK